MKGLLPAFIFASAGLLVSSITLVVLLVTRHNRRGLNRIWDLAILTIVTALIATATGVALLLHTGP